MSNKRIVITIDGLAASGKSTLAKLLAKRLSFAYFSSGLLYRTVGLLWLKNSEIGVSENSVQALLERHSFDVKKGAEFEQEALIDGNIVTNMLFSPEVSQATSQLSALSVVRQHLLDKQRTIFPGDNLVAEGRDMGTVVFPEADLKFFIEVDLPTRIERRVAQMGIDRESLNGFNLLKRKMEIEIIERDARDIERLNSPTIAASDSIKIDNSRQTLTEVVESMYDFVAKHGLIP